MGIFAKLFERRSQASAVENATSWLGRLFGGAPTASGVRVDEQSALRMVAVWACVRVIAETVASLPFPVYHRLGRGRERVHDHQVYRLLNQQPNPEVTPMVFREAVTAHVLTWGNGYIYILRNRYTGAPESLWLLLPDRTNPVRIGTDRRLAYRTQRPDGSELYLPAQDVIHIAGLGYDGLVGYSPIRMAMEAIGAGLAAEEFANRFYSQGTHIGGIVEIPGQLSEPAQDRLRESIKETHQGLGKSHLLMILEEGVKYHKIGVPPNEAQFLETRKFQAEEIARLYRVPPHKIGLLERSTFSNIEQQAIEFVTDTILPWCRRWEQAVNMRLFDEQERRDYYAEHLIEGILRGDMKTRYDSYAIGRQWGWLSANDVREKENLNPIEGGNIYMVPLNMVPASQVNAAEDQVPGTDDNNGGDETEQRTHQRTHQRTLEERSIQSAERLATAWQGVMTDATRRVIRREVADIRRALKRHLGQRSLADFRKWLTEFYRDAPEWIKTTFHPVISSFAIAIVEELKEDIELPADYAGRLDVFVSEYADKMAIRHAARHRREIEALFDDETEEAIAEAVSAHLGEWEEQRFRVVGRNETISVLGAVSRMAYTMGGVTYLRWKANPDACPYCQVLDGRVVGVDSPFVSPGDSLDPEDGTGPMSFIGRISHPPLHDGCQCTIVPERRE